MIWTCGDWQGNSFFLFWLPWVFIASWAFLVLLCRLSCPKACGILFQSQPGDWTCIPCIGGWILNHWTVRKSQKLSTLSHFTWAFMKNSAFRIVSLLRWWFWAPRETKQELPNLLKARPETSLISSPLPYSWSKQSQTSPVQGDTDPSIFQWEECQGTCSNLKSATISKIGK